LINDEALDFGLRINVIDGLLEAGQTVDVGDEDLLDPACL
jgi:hypothetical protein